MSTPVWLLAQVVKVWDFLVGIVVFHSLGLVIILPAVSSLIDSGVTSSSSRSCACEDPLAREGGGLRRGAAGDGLVRVDGRVGLLIVEELQDHGLHLRNARGAAHQDILVHVPLVDVAVAQALLDGDHGVAEVVRVSSSHRARGSGQEKSMPSKSESISIGVCAEDRRVLLARRLPARSLPSFLRLKS